MLWVLSPFVGGLEAESVMLGVLLTCVYRISYGVELSGKPQEAYG